MNLLIPIIAGKTTCASKPGKFCKFASETQRDKWPRCGTGVYSCVLFSKTLQADDGWLQRLPECIAAEDKDDDPPNP